MRNVDVGARIIPFMECYIEVQCPTSRIFVHDDKSLENLGYFLVLKHYFLFINILLKQEGVLINLSKFQNRICQSKLLIIAQQRLIILFYFKISNKSLRGQKLETIICRFDSILVKSLGSAHGENFLVRFPSCEILCDFSLEMYSSMSEKRLMC